MSHAGVPHVALRLTACRGIGSVERVSAVRWTALRRKLAVRGTPTQNAFRQPWFLRGSLPVHGENEHAKRHFTRASTARLICNTQRRLNLGTVFADCPRASAQGFPMTPSGTSYGRFPPCVGRWECVISCLPELSRQSPASRCQTATVDPTESELWDYA